MIRTVKPEILDILPENHPDALHNRRDLLLFNHLMGNFRWFCRELKNRLNENDRLLEIGAGLGELGQHLHFSLLNRRKVSIDGLDRWSRPPRWPESGTWHQVDLRSFNSYNHYSIVLANLVLHQFQDHELQKLGRFIGEKARLILVSEPARRKLHIHQARLARLFGTSYVTNHDARASIEAGFLGNELPYLLDLDPTQWICKCKIGFLGQYHMIAVRK